MELSSSIHESGPYIHRSDSKRSPSYNNGGRGDPPGSRGVVDVVDLTIEEDEDFDDEFDNNDDDQRQDVAITNNEQLPEHEQERNWTGDIATTVQNLGEFIFDWKDQHCHAPCFVNTSGSMDGGNPPNNNHNSRTQAPASPVGDEDDMFVSGSSLHAPIFSGGFPTHSPPAPPLRFPSIHLDADDWEDEDSAFFDVSDGMVGATRLPPPSQSIYRPPSNINNALSHGMTSSNNNNNNKNTLSCGASQASTVPTGNVGIYRSPAWSDEDDNDDDSDVVSIAADEDWLDIAPDSPTPNYGNHAAAAQGTGTSSTSVIDVTYMDDLFNDFTLSGGTGYDDSGRT